MRVVRNIVLYPQDSVNVGFSELTGSIEGWTISMTIRASRDPDGVRRVIRAEGLNVETREYGFTLPAVLFGSRPVVYYYDVARVDTADPVPLWIGTIDIRSESDGPPPQGE